MHCHRPGSKGESKDVSKLRWTDQERSSHRTYSSLWDLGSSDDRVRLLTNIYKLTYDAKFAHGMIRPGSNDRWWRFCTDWRAENVGHSSRRDQLLR